MNRFAAPVPNTFESNKVKDRLLDEARDMGAVPVSSRKRLEDGFTMEDGIVLLWFNLPGGTTKVLTAPLRAARRLRREKRAADLKTPYDFYNKYGGNYVSRFLERNTEFDTDEFREFLSANNRGDRDSGELQDIAKHEVLRLASEFEERKWRFPNVYGEPKE